MSPSESFRRNPLVISGNSLMSGGRSTSFATGSPGSLLRTYLIFVREMRGQRREPSIELRTADVAVIASHLGVTSEYVLGGLLDLMGATREQRGTMMAMLAAGALTLVLTGSFVSDLSTDGISVEMPRLAEAVQAAASDSENRAQFERSSESADPSAAVGSATNSPSPSRLTEAAASTPRPDVLRSAASASTAADAEAATPETNSTATDSGAGAAQQVGSVAGEPVSIDVSPDGSLVASVAPPVPVATTDDEQVATAELPDGTTVGVTAPPVPAATTDDEQVATAELPDGTTVGVAAPPVPPPSGD